MAHVLSLLRYSRKGASSRVRMLQYYPHLEKLGHTFTTQCLLSDEYLDRLYTDGSRSTAAVAASCAQRVAAMLRHGRGEIVWLQREVLPFAPFFLENLMLSGRKIVADYDDAVHTYYKSLRAGWAQTLFGDKVERQMRRADVVTVGNSTLGDLAKRVGARRVEFIPSAVDIARFPASLPPERFTVGWIGTPMTAMDALPMIAEPLIRFLKETGARCLLVGVRPDQFPNIPAERIPWSEAIEETVLPRISVGLCPLEDNEWNRGKSGYKIIQYMSAGRASLVSPVAIAGDLIAHGETGLHCRASQDWYDGLMRLSQDRALCAAYGRRAREVAVATTDTSVAAAQIHRIFQSLT